MVVLNSSVKIHLPLLKTVVQGLEEVFLKNAYSDKVLERIFKNNKKLGARDRKFVAESFYDAIRWWRLLGAKLNQVENEILSVQQIEERVLVLLGEKGFAIPESFKEKFLLALKFKSNSIAINESIPDWMNEFGQEQLGDRWTLSVRALNQPAPVDLRTNTLKITREKLKIVLQEEAVLTEAIPNTMDGLSLLERKNIFSLKAFQSGFFEVQDRASQQVAPLLNVESGQRVIDACAGAGGKTLHLASLMKNKGKIISMDVQQWKLDELKTRCRRNGIDIVETRLIDSSKVIKRLKESCDALLLDVPCSGLGVLRRNPDAKWKLKLEEINRLNELQRQILNDYCQMVKPGGLMVYSTCSFLPSENNDQVMLFLKQNSGWVLEEEVKVFPEEGRGDGFYAARLKRSSSVKMKSSS